MRTERGAIKVVSSMVSVVQQVHQKHYDLNKTRSFAYIVASYYLALQVGMFFTTNPKKCFTALLEDGEKGIGKRVMGRTPYMRWR